MLKIDFRLFIMWMFIPVLLGCEAIKKLPSKAEGEVVNLSRKGLTSIPEEIFENKAIRVLKLYGNKLDTLSDRIGELENLEKLYIGRNQLTSLPASISKLKKLKLLSIQYNDLEDLPMEIGELTSLEHLILNQNQLTTLPSSIGKLSNLETLQLKFNQLDSLPTEIGNCKQLRFIYLNRNNLIALPESMGKLSQLREIHLAGAGALVLVPENFCELRYLELIEIDQSTALPPCMLVLQTNRLQIVQR